jgi:formylglycine-generating enzyme required for sulfatase activity
MMGNNPSHFKGDPNRPVETVSWDDAQEFLRRLSEKEGKAYRLPTEAEWEYAARAGTTTAYCFGDDVSLLREYGWYTENSGGRTRAVGQLEANAWGLHDMHGNVWEWVQDRYAADYYQQSGIIDPKGPEEGEYRVLRGGSWGIVAGSLRVSTRHWLDPGHRSVFIGFRCAV